MKPGFLKKYHAAPAVKSGRLTGIAWIRWLCSGVTEKQKSPEWSQLEFKLRTGKEAA
jgi:hypothetical protein